MLSGMSILGTNAGGHDKQSMGKQGQHEEPKAKLWSNTMP